MFQFVYLLNIFFGFLFVYVWQKALLEDQLANKDNAVGYNINNKKYLVIICQTDIV
jgi:hypothetical protein